MSKPILCVSFHGFRRCSQFIAKCFPFLMATSLNSVPRILSIALLDQVPVATEAPTPSAEVMFRTVGGLWLLPGVAVDV